MAQKNGSTNKPQPRQASKGKVITGKAAEAEMAAMQREAKREQRSKGKR